MEKIGVEKTGVEKTGGGKDRGGKDRWEKTGGESTGQVYNTCTFIENSTYQINSVSVSNFFLLKIHYMLHLKFVMSLILYKKVDFNKALSCVACIFL